MTNPDPATGQVSGSGFIDQLEAMIPQMRAFARSLCRNADLADDLVQDACLRAWGARDRFIPGAPMRPWLFKIIRNLHTGHNRKAWRSESLDPDDAENALVTPSSQEWTSDFRVMETALRHLPEKQREALIAVLAAGFSYEEAACLLGCSEGTVKSRVSRGREALAGLMESRSLPPSDRSATTQPETLPVIADIAQLFPGDEVALWLSRHPKAA
ncbi:MAG: sigma-70 family RNA polymerase sigma factor [Hyphomonas sp.]